MTSLSDGRQGMHRQAVERWRLRDRLPVKGGV